MNTARSIVIAGLWCGVAVWSTGCASALLAPRIVTGPAAKEARQGFSNAAPEARVALARTYAHDLRVPVAGSPPVEIAVGVIEPGNYQLDYTVNTRTVDGSQPRYSVNIYWEPLAADAPKPACKGTVVLLHGFWMNREAVLHWALRLAPAGYRCVLVDLRGHGSSVAPWVTYGAREVQDMRAVLDDLQQRGLADERVAVLGISYGAAVGLQWAADDVRIATVVALAPFADPRLAIRQYARAMLSPTANRAVSDGAIRGGTARAAKLAGFRWDQVDVLKAVRALRGPVLFVHGDADQLIPTDHSRRLVAVAPEGSRLIEVPGDDHFAISMRLAGIQDEVQAWLDAHLGAAERP